MARMAPAPRGCSFKAVALPCTVRPAVHTPIRPHHSNAPRRRLQRVPAISIDVAATMSALQHQLEEELVMEGALHVSAVQVGSCMQRFGSALDSFEAPELASDSAASGPRPLAWEAGSKAEEEAVCLATPCDPGETRSARQARVAGGPSYRISSTAEGNSEEQVSMLADELLQQRAALLNLSSGMTEALEASSNVRRRRRRNLIRLLRASRNHARALLALPAAALDGSFRA